MSRAGLPASVLFVHSGQDWITGSERCLLDLVAHLDRSRFAPVVACDAPALARAALALGVPVHQTAGWPVAASRWLPSRAEVAGIRALVRAHDVRLVHANDTEPIKAILPVARQYRIPVLAHLHITIDEAERRWSFVHQAALAVGVSEAAVAGLREDGFPESRITVVHNGVDPSRLEQGDASGLRAQLGASGEAVVFTALGSLIHRKGVDVVLDAFDIVSTRRSDVHLLICGDGPDRARFEARASRMAERGRVHFLGSRRDAGAILRDATDVLTSGSRDEAFPLSILEAAYFGIPIVATSIPPHREFLGDGRAGVLVLPDDAPGMAAAMERLAAAPDLRRALGAEARRRVIESYLLPSVVRRFEEIYAQLLSAPRSRFGWVRGSTWPRSYTRWAMRVLAGRRARGSGARRPAADEMGSGVI